MPAKATKRRLWKTVKGAELVEGKGEVATEQGQEQEQRSSRPKYWVSERSVGEFHRAFSFSSRVDQDSVTASLKNGVLSVVVPNAASYQAKRINVD